MAVNNKKDIKKDRKVRPVIIGTLLVALVMLLSTFWTGRAANDSMEEAVRSVSLMYLDELAGR